MGRKRVYRVERGITLKVCSGPTHEKPVWLPVAEFTIHKTKGHQSWCRNCDTTRRGMETLVLRFDYDFAIIELVNRIGAAETTRRIEMTDRGFYRIYNRKTTYMRKSTARKIIRVLIEARATDEVRHRHSIKRGAYLRGEDELPVLNRARDINKPFGDLSLEQARRYRHENHSD